MSKAARILSTIIIALVPVLAVLLPPAAPAFAQTTPTLYEDLSAGGDADSDDLYGAIWAGMQFTADADSHTISSVRVEIKRTGSPGILTLSVRAADTVAGPEGLDLTVAYIDGDTISTAYEMQEFDVPDISIEGAGVYAIVLRATQGDVANYIEWHLDSGGGLANAVQFDSTNSGVAWATNAPADALFEVYGFPSMEIHGANVFSGYLTPGDWLITTTITSTYAPYYPAENPADYFYISLYDVAGAVLLKQTTLKAWGYRPASIYIRTAEASVLQWDSAYILRIYGVSGSGPFATYTLVPGTDWKGSDGTKLDSWVTTQGKLIEAADGTDLVTTGSGTGETLTMEGQAIFLTGIPELNRVRPALFTLSTQTLAIATPTYNESLQNSHLWSTMLGAEISSTLTEVGTTMSTTGKETGTLFAFFAVLGIAVVVTMIGSLAFGLTLGGMATAAFAWLGVIDWIVAAIFGIIMAVFFVWGVIFKS